MKLFLMLAVSALVYPAPRQRPSAKAGEQQDKAGTAAAGKPYSGKDAHERVGETQDRAAKEAEDARDAQSDEIQQQDTRIRFEAEPSADKLEVQTKRVCAGADKRADVVDDCAKPVRQKVSS